MSIESTRNGCLFQGAIETLSYIHGVVPVAHSTRGCSMQSYLSGREFHGGEKIDAFEVPSSNITEKHVVFGGTSRLREQIKNTVKVVNGEIYVIVTGCAPELVGDDALYMAKESREQGNEVIHINAPGFNGKHQNGYEIVVKNLLNKFLNENEINNKSENLVNIFGIVPNSDLYWRGALDEIKRLLEGIGVKVNTLIGSSGDVNEWRDAHLASLNLVFSPWGEDAAKYLEDKYNTPYINLYHIPLGEIDTKNFILNTAKALNIEEKNALKFINNEVNRTRYYTFSGCNIYNKNTYRKRFSVVGTFSSAVSITRFLTHEIGLIPERIIITDNINDDSKKGLGKHLDNIFSSTNESIFFTDDAGEIKDILKESKTEILFGSSLEEGVAKEIEASFVITSSPSVEESFLSKSYVGFHGGIHLLEDLINSTIKIEKDLRAKAKNSIEKLVSEFY